MTSQANTQCLPLVHVPTTVTHAEALVNFTGPSSVYTQQAIDIYFALTNHENVCGSAGTNPLDARLLYQ
jgi:hypothetical protein